MEFFSQVGQDRFIFDNFFRGRRGGVFVDVGAYDGVKHSNSLFLERYMGWTGLCIEPMPGAFAKLAGARKARCLQLGVSDFEGEADFVECDAGVDEQMLSGLSQRFDPRHVERIGKVASARRGFKVPVRRLSAILEEQGLYEIDYCSIDTEGAEFSILSELDMQKFRIGVFTVENNYNDPKFAALMSAKGYDLIGRLAQDDIYCRRDIRRLPRTSVICAVWHGDPGRERLLAGHAENLADQDAPVEPIYVFDGGAQPPPGFAAKSISTRLPLTIYQAWNLALSLVELPMVMNLNLDDRLAPDAVTTLENAMVQNGAQLVGGDWKICYSQAETDLVRPCYPAEQLPFVSGWPPPVGTATRFGSGTGNRPVFGPAVLWRMDAHMGAPRYPWRFADGTPIKIVADWAWTFILGNHMKKKLVRIPVIVGNYHSHPGEQAEFRGSSEKEHELFRLTGISAL